MRGKPHKNNSPRLLIWEMASINGDWQFYQASEIKRIAGKKTHQASTKLAKRLKDCLHFIVSLMKGKIVSKTL